MAGGRVDENCSQAVIKAAIADVFSSNDENGNRADPRLGLNPSFPLRLTILFCSLVNATISTSSYGSPVTNHVVTLNAPDPQAQNPG